MKYNNLPFNYLPTLKQKACYILYLAGFTYQEIESLGMVSRKTITRAIKSGNEQYHLNRYGKKH